MTNPSTVQKPMSRRGFLISAAVGFAIICGLGAWLLRDRDKALVVGFLHKTLDDPTVQIVRWWPPVDPNSMIDSEIAGLHRIIDEWKRDISEKRGTETSRAIAQDSINLSEVSIHAIEEYRPFRLCRLKYRTMKQGSLVLQDQIFMIDGAAVQVYSDDRISQFFFNLFPE